jgi:hypothetical protein
MPHNALSVTDGWCSLPAVYTSQRDVIENDKGPVVSIINRRSNTCPGQI